MHPAQLIDSFRVGVASALSESLLAPLNEVIREIRLSDEQKLLEALRSAAKPASFHKAFYLPGSLIGSHSPDWIVICGR